MRLFYRSLSFTSLLALAACGSSPSDTARDTASPTDTASPPDTTAPTDTAPPPDTTPTPPPWQHVDPITHAPAPAPTFPLFTSRAEALPEGLTLPEGRSMVVDFDGDGRDDLVVLGTTASLTPIFLRNTTPAGGPWSFDDFTPSSGMEGILATIIVFGDIDNDGDLDAFVGTSFRSAPGDAYGIWKNDGAGHFTFAGNDGLARNKIGQYYKEMSAATLADLDQDGFLDLYIGMWNPGNAAGNLGMQTKDELYRGDGTGKFASFDLPNQNNPLTGQMDPSLAGYPRRAYGLCPADFDDDGDLDLFVNNYGAGRPAMDDPPHYWEWNFLWRNDGAMSFTDVGETAQVHATPRGINQIQAETPVVYQGTTYPGPIGGNGFGCSWGDFDNDGDLDLAVGQIAHPDYPQTDRLLLHVNPGGAPGSSRVFTEESLERGLQYYEDELHPVLVDIDRDGRLDLAVSRLRGGSKWEVYLQNSAQKFEKKTWAESGIDITQPGPTLWLDVDQDGDLDLFMPKSASGQLFENTATSANWLSLELLATAPKDATGARVTLTSSVGTQMRELIGGTGHYNTQQTRHLLFGLGGDSGAAQVTIRWPNGERQLLGDVRANVKLRVTQGGSIELLP